MQSTTTNSVIQKQAVLNRVLRNTYLLLSLTLLFSAFTAYLSLNAAPMHFMVLLVGMFGFYFLTMALRNSSWGILAIFLYTGFMGYALGPILNFYIHQFANGPELVMTALGATGVIFFTLSAYVLTTRKSFSYMGGFLAIAVMTAFLAGLASMIFNLPTLSLLVSGVFVLVSSGFILYHTSEIIQGGERNYIVATISLYIAIFNLFVNLLRLLSVFAGNRN